ncbi:MAG: hypothetical protein QXM27_01665 [Candidatus Pacearchaeota archaeon]
MGLEDITIKLEKNNEEKIKNKNIKIRDPIQRQEREGISKKIKKIINSHIFSSLGEKLFMLFSLFIFTYKGVLGDTWIHPSQALRRAIPSTPIPQKVFLLRKPHDANLYGDTITLPIWVSQYPGGDTDITWIGDFDYFQPWLKRSDTLYAWLKYNNDTIAWFKWCADAYYRIDSIIPWGEFFPDFCFNLNNNIRPHTVAVGPYFDTTVVGKPDSIYLYLKDNPNKKLDAIVDWTSEVLYGGIYQNYIFDFPIQELYEPYSPGDSFIIKIKKIKTKDTIINNDTIPLYNIIYSTTLRDAIDTTLGNAQVLLADSLNNYVITFPQETTITDIYPPYIYNLYGPVGDTTYAEKYNVNYNAIDYSNLESKLVYKIWNGYPSTDTINPDSVVGNKYYFTIYVPNIPDTIYGEYYGYCKDVFGNIGYSDTNSFYIPQLRIKEYKHKYNKNNKIKPKKIVYFGKLPKNLNKNIKNYDIFDLSGRKTFFRRKGVYIIKPKDYKNLKK